MNVMTCPFPCKVYLIFAVGLAGLLLEGCGNDDRSGGSGGPTPIPTTLPTSTTGSHHLRSTGSSSTITTSTTSLYQGAPVGSSSIITTSTTSSYQGTLEYQLTGVVTLDFAQDPQMILSDDDAVFIVKNSAQESIAEILSVPTSNVTITSLSIAGADNAGDSRRLQDEFADADIIDAEVGNHSLKFDYKVAEPDEVNVEKAKTKLKSEATTTLRSKMNEKMNRKIEELPADDKADLQAAISQLQVMGIKEVFALATKHFPFANGDDGVALDVPTCVAEAALRRILKPKCISPNVIRGIFHDAIDQDNLLVKNRTSGLWQAVSGSYGGVDGCLYSPLTQGTKGTPNPGHNRNIMNGFKFADICNDICKHPWPAGLVGTSLCRSIADCKVDITVLGSLLTVENAGGPVMDMSWGRRKSDCSEDNIVTPFTKSIDKKREYDKNPALNQAPDLTGIDEPDQFRNAFKHFGFSAVDQVALMGAHSFGQLQVCAGGLNGIEHGPFCKDSSKVSVKMGNGSAWYAPPEAWGDGGLWDRTPTKFDNDYFKLFDTEEFASKDDCCGKIKSGQCHRGGTMVRITMRNDDGTAVASKTKQINGSACGVSWCRSDRKGRTHMKSTKAWTTVDSSWAGFGKSGKHGLQKRMIRLAGDWALLADPDTKSKVQEFAKDESAFFAAFSVAWGKVIRKTHNHLSSCTGKADAADVDRAVAALSCKDLHWKCPSIGCRPGKWGARCPRQCGKCPDQ